MFNKKTIKNLKFILKFIIIIIIIIIIVIQLYNYYNKQNCKSIVINIKLNNKKNNDNDNKNNKNKNNKNNKNKNNIKNTSIKELFINRTKEDFIFALKIELITGLPEYFKLFLYNKDLHSIGENLVSSISTGNLFERSSITKRPINISTKSNSIKYIILLFGYKNLPNISTSNDPLLVNEFLSSESSHIVETKPQNINYVVINKHQRTSQKNLLISNLVKKFSNKQNTISSNINKTINDISSTYPKNIVMMIKLSQNILSYEDLKIEIIPTSINK